jgi:hypothetical protein
VRAAIAPTLTAATVPDVLVDSWISALESGALAQLLAVPNQKFTNLELAGAYRQMFDTMTAEAKGRGYRGYSRARRTTAGHFY